MRWRKCRQVGENALFCHSDIWPCEAAAPFEKCVTLWCSYFPPRWVLLLDLYSLWASWIPGWWVHLLTLRSWPVADWWPNILLRPSWGLYHVGRCLGDWANYHCLCRVRNKGLSTWCQFITGPHRSVCFCICMAVEKGKGSWPNPTPKSWFPIIA